MEGMLCSSFSSNPLLLYWTHIDVSVRHGGGKVNSYNLMIRLNSFGGSLCLAYSDLFTSVSYFLTLSNNKQKDLAEL